MGCPINKYPNLTDKQIENFCKAGCSVECEKLLDEYVKNLKKRGTYHE